jgi:AbrB family looped-hinge helix DNA binding protein
MRVTAKGQVTIPKHIRDKAGLGPGSEVRFSEEGGKIVVSKAAPGSEEAERRVREFDEWLAQVRGSADAGLSADQIMDLTRGPERHGGAG